MTKVSRFGWCVVAMAMLGAPGAQAAWLVKQVKVEGKRAEVLSSRHVEREVRSDDGRQVLRSIPRYISEDAPPSGGLFEEVLYTDEAAPAAAKYFKARKSVEFSDATEVRTLVEQGPQSNRITLTLVGDGYTLAEKEKFFADANRLKDELFAQEAFTSYLPLFNVYAVYVESRESGVTDGSNRRDTALGLYRDPPGSKRGIMPGNTTAIDAALDLAPHADYPILIANDDFYGGLGGEYAITTRSVESGIVVLRHELGHNFGQVGEEYDNGYVYSGANASRTPTNPSWKHWLTVPTTSHVYETKLLSGDYVWQNLGSKPYSADFNFPAPSAGVPYEFEVIVSTVGWSSPDDVYVYFDGQKVALEGQYTIDRSFFTFKLAQTPAPGKHKLEIRENLKDGNNVLAFAELYAQPRGFDSIPGEIAAFATFDANGSKSYRPTHESCPMRDMKHAHFCSVDQENMWGRFLARVSLVDELKVEGTQERKISLQTPPLKGLDIRWFKLDAQGRESELTAIQGQSVWTADAQTRGNYRVKLQFRTDEVRKYTSAFDVQKDLKL